MTAGFIQMFNNSGLLTIASVRQVREHNFFLREDQHSESTASKRCILDVTRVAHHVRTVHYAYPGLKLEFEIAKKYSYESILKLSKQILKGAIALWTNLFVIIHLQSNLLIDHKFLLKTYDF